MGNCCNSNKKYNSENNVSISINSNRKCYLNGEFINGSIYLKGKQGLIITQLLDPLAIATLTEFQHYTYEEDRSHDDHREIDVNDEKKIFQIRLDFTNYRGANLMDGVQMPFNFQINNCLPTCYFNYKTYKSPSIEIKEIEKHKLMINKGKFAAVLKLAKNVFTYEENIPFELEIDCSQLDMEIKSVEIYLLRIENKNYKNMRNKVRNSSSSKISSKKINLIKGQPKYLINDDIQFPILVDFSPIQIYKYLDSLPEINEKITNKIHLAPSCMGGLLSVDYFLIIEFNIDSILTTDEKIKMRIDFYSPYDNNQQNHSNFNFSQESMRLNQAYNRGCTNNYY